jgi:hypothetical protein
VSYTHEDLNQERSGASETKISRTTKHTENVQEREQAEKLRTKLRGMISGACWPSMFGLFCPNEDRGGKGPTALRSAVIRAQKMVKDYNNKSRTCRVLLPVIPARVESSDAVAMAGIAAEMRAACEEMRRELSLGKPENARKLANKMRDLGRMLDDQSASVASGAIAAARKAASAIVKDGADTAKKAADILNNMNLDPIDAARVAFLDLEAQCSEQVSRVGPSADVQRVAGIELGEKAPSAQAPGVPQPSRELQLD